MVLFSIYVTIKIRGVDEPAKVKNIGQGSAFLFSKQFREDDIRMLKKETGPLPHTICQSQLKTRGKSQTMQIIKLLRKKKKEPLDFELGDDFLDFTPKTQAKRTNGPHQPRTGF